MKRILLFVVPILITLIANKALFSQSLPYDYQSVDPVLSSAEDLFIAFQNNEYASAWALLSKKSQQEIVNDVYKSSKTLNGGISREQVRDDFSEQGTMFRSFWSAFLHDLDVNIVLEQSLWAIGSIDRNKAEIIITYKRSRMPTRLQMFRESGDWKVGLVETFWPRKQISFLNYLFQ